MKLTWWVLRGTSAAALFSLPLMLVGCGDQPAPGGASGEHGATAAEFERGPNRGRMLRSGDFALEITIFETGVPPEFHVYAYRGDKPVDPSKVSLAITLKRLGKTDKLTFRPDKDFLVSTTPVKEPHSFDVVVAAAFGGNQHNWSFQSYEGRTTIAAKAATGAGITIEKAGPATIEQTIELLGNLDLAPGAKAELRARFPGKIISTERNVGDKVRAGETLARVESNESLQTYAITAPFDGVVLERNANVGDAAGDGVLFIVGKPNKLVAHFHVFDRDTGRVKPGQTVRIRPLHGTVVAEAAMGSVSPVADPTTQTIIARAPFEDASGSFLSGMTVKGEVVIERVPVPLAVKTAAIQRFRDFEVVFARFGETYEVRMLEIGRRTVEWVEVLDGIDPGQDYVVENSFMIKADIEKSGASHDH